MRLVFPIAESPTMPTFMTTLLQKEERLVQVDQEEESNHPTNDSPLTYVIHAYSDRRFDGMSREGRYLFFLEGLA
jgi:hypothetical protein